MHAHVSYFSPAHGWANLPTRAEPPDFVLLFGARELFQAGAALDALSATLPRERFFGCSTAGEIEEAHVCDGSIVATSVWLGKAHIRVASVSLSHDAAGSAEAAGKLLAERVAAEGLRHVFVLSDGTQVNGTQLVDGLTKYLPAGVSLSGGLSGDGAAMKETVVCHAGQVSTGTISAIGFIGDIRVGTGSVGGWDAFGPIRKVTRATGNVLFELDGEPALALYKRYLGEHAASLPAGALRFPLRLMPRDGEPVVRTILGVDEAAQSMTFAGDLPVGAEVQLMRANFDRLVMAGERAAEASLSSSGSKPELAVLISCVGRRLILKQRTEEEVEAVRSVLGEDVHTTGFYSYGELSPVTGGARCQLHNQTMTITTFSEAAPCTPS